MATITTDTFLDSGTARTAGETWSISLSNLTVRTDTRWHANAPASMTGTFGTVTLNQSGGLIIDGTKVRWISFVGGIGVVPAIGTTMSNYGAEGVTGYLLGVWPDLASAPLAPGATMPSTGFLKFREVTGGVFPSSGGFYEAGGIMSCGSGGPEQAGWIEVVFDSTTNNQHSVTTGNGFKTLGDWFYLDNTTGVRGQILSTPINGGGALSLVPGVQIETAPGSNVFEWWPAVENTGWTSTYKPLPDDRAKLVGTLASGQIIIGSNGAADVSSLPPSGCRVRIPNIIIRQALAASRSQNNNAFTSTGSNARFANPTAAGVYNLDKTMFCIGVDANTSYSFTMTDSVFFALRASTNYNQVSITNCARGEISAAISSGNIFECVSNLGSVNINNLKIFYKDSVNFTPMNNAVVTNLEIINQRKTAAAPQSISLSGSNSTFSGTFLCGVGFTVTGSYNSFIDTDYVEYLDSPTLSTGSSSVFTLQGFFNTVDGLTFGKQGSISNTHPSATTGIISINAGYGHRVRNIGTYLAPLDCGVTSTTYPQRAVYVSGSAVGNPFFQTKVQRVYVSNTRTSTIGTVSSTAQNILFESISSIANTAVSGSLFAQNCIYRDINLGSNYDPTGFGYSGTVGTNFFDYRRTGTDGRLFIVTLDDGANTSGFVSTNFTSPNSGFDTNGFCRLTAIGDFIIVESPHVIYGHTRLGTAALDISQVGCSTQYQIDTGSGYGGTWKILNTTNLFAEGVISNGFKFKLKFTATSNSTSNYGRYAFIPTTVPASLIAPPYALDTVTLSFEGLQPGSEVRAYVGTDPATAVEIGGIESVSGTTWSFTHSSAGEEGYIAVFALGFNPLFIQRTYASSDSTLLISQVVDRNYINP